ncbi:MAG: InlB B-repeat-containing protein, partial [Bacteroidales bacterium]|nr:InlB B-repeat-containing protein [Bacteroidales bacterium]
MKKIAFPTMLCLMLAVFINSCEPFIEPPKHFSVVFHANGGKGSMKMQIMNMGNEESLKLSPNTFTRDGYVFAGWNTEATGKGRVFKDRQIISSHENLSLYAQWKSAGSSGSSTTENGHEWVDLGLPSGLKWATCNVGATKPEGYGHYFAWGETSPKDNYDWSTYKYCNGSAITLTKYNNESVLGTVDRKSTLEFSDDAARVNWGGKWRMPTKAELQELGKYCDWTWTIQNGVKGYKVISKTNGNSIFLPATGYCQGTSGAYPVGQYGYFWTSSLFDDPLSAHCLYQSSDALDGKTGGNRPWG